ncbi:MAG: leucine--tRNA ligase [Myxococcales bacterium]|nr:leucine--tRNA ligase [Myxococcales bacterium]
MANHPRPEAGQPTVNPDERFDFATTDAKWQQFWVNNKTFKADIDPDNDKRAFVLDMFPYPSGAGLHVGHPEGYTATDIWSRYQRHNGVNVLHPMGWDAFGLPAEQYAIKTGTHPRETTKKNVDNFRRQIQALGFSYDWDREVDTTDPNYFKWTQWIFLKLFERGLAYQSEIPVNWCPALGTVLANEEVIDGLSERGSHPVERRPMRQWMLAITAYAEELLAGVDGLQWGEGIKTMQRNWVGRSEGAEVAFAVEGHEVKLRVYTTRPDTLFGATYMVVAPEHALLDVICSDGQRGDVVAYAAAATRKSERDRQDERKEKTGVFTGAYAINPVNGERVPVWTADYVLGGYGTGAIMAVPGHDVRDFAFATTFELPIKRVVMAADGDPNAPLEEAFSATGVACNSGEFDGLTTAEFKQRISKWLTDKGLGEAKTNYKLRDWVFSRQRYWGEPIPIYYPCFPGDGATDRQLWDPRRGDAVTIDYKSPIAVAEEELPLRLPETDDYKPNESGEPPLARCLDWRFFERDGQWYARETNTMPQWAGSCWYYLRYADPTNPDFIASPEAIDYWLPVTLYVGGAEHAVLHLLYARFWHKVLHDIGVVPHSEPFPRLVNQGMILGEDGEKMSKSRGNVINPDDMLSEFGTDAFRLYIMFMGPLEKVKPWQTAGMHGTRRFMYRFWSLYQKQISDAPLSGDQQSLLHALIKKVGEDTEALRFNTAIAAMMEALNDLLKSDELNREIAETLVVLISPYAPHMAEELWARLGYEPSVSKQPWPVFDPAKLVKASYLLPVMVNGKVRAKIEVPTGSDETHLETVALSDSRIMKWTEGKVVRKIIVKPGRMVSIVAK